MKTSLFLTCLAGICVAALSSGSCTQENSMKCHTYEELPDPTADTLSDWSGVARGLHASFVNANIRYPRSVAPEVKTEKSQSLTGWKGEKLSAQLLLWTVENATHVTCQFSDFESSSAVLPGGIAQARFVRYVLTDEFGNACGAHNPDDYPPSLSADMLDTLTCFDLEAKSVRPVWLTVAVPPTAAPGAYRATLTVSANGRKTHACDVELNVLDRLLPPPSEWKFHLDLWQHPPAVARVRHVPLWSDAHFAALKETMQPLADAGQKVITATLNKDPWNQQTYDLYADMIVWTKKTDGAWTYDYGVFDRWVELMMETGVNRMINCYSMIPWNNEFHYTDAASDQKTVVRASPGSEAYEALWTPFLQDFTTHLKEKGWLEKTSIAMDERSPEAMDATIKLLQRVAPELGIALADNHKSYKRYPHIKDISVAASARVDPEDIASRKADGLITSYYVCCADLFPNMFTFSDPAEAVYCAWYATAAGYDGLLRWAYNWWTENPLLDSRYIRWPAGDTYIVYPDARSSIRFERLVEGIQDAEKIRILREEWTAMTSDDAANKLKTLNLEIEKFHTVTPSRPTGETVDHARRCLNELSK
ncbi:MAG: DUF4091 domain-containing protein [Tannerella sp.]|jgi:hypothetical protein|nr:DUF4091 domain-containing protein [Tannerella sp.]